MDLLSTPVITNVSTTPGCALTIQRNCLNNQVFTLIINKVYLYLQSACKVVNKTGLF